MQLENAKQLPIIFYARHMFPGLAGYENERILVDSDAMKAMMPSFAGKPLYVYHQAVDVENLQEQADGYIVDSFYNELDGWLWVKAIAVSDKAHEAINNGWSVSNAYVPTEWGVGGYFHNVEYDRKIANGTFTHLALVPNPRYENAAVMLPDEYKAYCAAKAQELKELQNSKNETQHKNGAKMFNLFKLTKEKVNTIDGDTMLELEDGKAVSVQEMINAVKRNSETEKEKEEDAEKVNMDTEVTVGEEKMPLRELVNKYMTMTNKKNAEDGKEKEEDEKENESDDEESEEKDNESDSDAEGKKDKEEEKQNHFDELLNAHNKAKAPTSIETSMDKMARGKARYGATIKTK